MEHIYLNYSNVWNISFFFYLKWKSTSVLNFYSVLFKISMYFNVQARVIAVTQGSSRRFSFLCCRQQAFYNFIRQNDHHKSPVWEYNWVLQSWVDSRWDRSTACWTIAPAGDPNFDSGDHRLIFQAVSRCPHLFSIASYGNAAMWKGEVWI